MNTFIRLSDNLEMTELDIDPLTTIPNINFRPNETEYVVVRQWAKPSFDEVTQEIVSAPTALVDGIWTQQWEVVALSAEIITANALVVETAEALVVSNETTARNARIAEITAAIPLNSALSTAVTKAASDMFVLSGTTLTISSL